MNEQVWERFKNSEEYKFISLLLDRMSFDMRTDLASAIDGLTSSSLPNEKLDCSISKIHGSIDFLATFKNTIEHYEKLEEVLTGGKHGQSREKASS